MRDLSGCLAFRIYRLAGFARSDGRRDGCDYAYHLLCRSRPPFAYPQRAKQFLWWAQGHLWRSTLLAPRPVVDDVHQHRLGSSRLVGGSLVGRRRRAASCQRGAASVRHGGYPKSAALLLGIGADRLRTRGIQTQTILGCAALLFVSAESLLILDVRSVSYASWAVVAGMGAGTVLS